MDIENHRRRRRIIHISLLCVFMVIVYMYKAWYSMNLDVRRYRLIVNDKQKRKRDRLTYLNRVIKESDVRCRSELRMDRSSFFNLCEMLKEKGGLRGTTNMSLEEIVAIFVNVLAHHKKNRTIGVNMIRSGETISRQFHNCLQAMLKLHSELLKTPTPIEEDSADPKWKHFKSCLGALDGTHIRVTPPRYTKARYRTRKGELTMNVLGVCAPDMQFVYVLSGWEGSSHDARVLKDALSKDFRVPQGCYYLVDAGYSNARGFLAPYRRQRYHLREWGLQQPQSAEEFFNMHHARARNTIERCFGILKKQWSVLRSPSFFPILTQSRVIYACCLLHNFLRRRNQMEDEETDVNDEDDSSEDELEEDNEDVMEFISSVHSSNEWVDFRNTMAQDMFNAWRAGA